MEKQTNSAVHSDDISKAFEALPQLIEKRQKELDEQQKQIAEERKALEAERKLYGASKGSDYDVIHLNV